MPHLGRRLPDKNRKMSLLGLAGYGSDHSEVDDAQKQPKDQESTQESINSSTPAQGETASGGSGDLLEGTTDVRQGGSLGDEGGSGEDQEAPGIAMKSSPVDAPQRLSKEPKPFFMPLPSPLVRIDNASQGYSSTLAMQDSSPNEDSEAKEGEGEEYGEGEQGDVDVDIIKPEFRGMLPPEATGQANAKLQSKIATFLDTIQGDFTKKIKSKKDYGNPAVLAQASRKQYYLTCTQYVRMGTLAAKTKLFMGCKRVVFPNVGSSIRSTV